MKYFVNLYGWNREYILGSVPEETWDYIQENFDGDADEYWSAVENGDVPDDYVLGCGYIEECDDVYHDYQFYLEQSHIQVTDEDGNEVYKCDLKDLRNLQIKRSRNTFFIGKNVPYLSSCVYGAKGGVVCELECDKFDPANLELSYSVIFFDDGGDPDSEKGKTFFDGPIVTGLFYGDIALDLCDGDDVGKYAEKEFLDRSVFCHNDDA